MHWAWKCLGKAVLLTEAGCHSGQAWNPLLGTSMQAEASCHLCWAHGHLVEAVFQVRTGRYMCHVCSVWGYLMGVAVQAVTGRCFCQAWGSTARGTVCVEASRCLFGFVDP